MIAKKVAIVLVNYNNDHDTLDALASIKSSNLEELPFVIVIDNSSKSTSITDSSAFYRDIKVIVSKTNIGFARANNLGIEWLHENVTCDYIFILNNDTELEKDALQHLINFMDSSDTQTVVCTPQILVQSDPNEVWYGGGSFNYNRLTPRINKSRIMGQTDFASGCAMFFKTSALKVLGGFDPYFFMYDEDVELSIRLKLLNMKIVYIPQSIIYHKCQGSQVSEGSVPSNQLDPRHPSLLFYLNNTIKNRKYIIRKHLRGKQKLKSTSMHFIYWICKSMQYLVHGKPKAFSTVLRQLLSPTIRINESRNS
jgi:GT2 family glycosyltransferase